MKQCGPMGQSHGGLLHQDYSNNLARYKEIVKNIISGEGENIPFMYQSVQKNCVIHWQKL